MAGIGFPRGQGPQFVPVESSYERGLKTLSLGLVWNPTRCFLVEIFPVGADKAKGYVVALLLMAPSGG